MHNQTYIATVPTKELKLGSGGDQGGGGFYEELMTGREGAGFVDQFGGAVFEILEDLFQLIFSIVSKIFWENCAQCQGQKQFLILCEV